jgi:hypothetical protein
VSLGLLQPLYPAVSFCSVPTELFCAPCQLLRELSPSVAAAMSDAQRFALGKPLTYANVRFARGCAPIHYPAVRGPTSLAVTRHRGRAANVCY